MAGATSAPAKQEKDMKQKTTRSDKTVIWVLSGACVLALIAVIVLLFVPMGTKTAAFTPAGVRSGGRGRGARGAG